MFAARGKRLFHQTRFPAQLARRRHSKINYRSFEANCSVVAAFCSNDEAKSSNVEVKSRKSVVQNSIDGVKSLTDEAKSSIFLVFS